MTYKHYSPNDLDRLVLHVFDIAALLREMSLTARRNRIDEIPMHDRKANQWCESLEQWAKKSKMNLELLVADLSQES